METAQIRGSVYIEPHRGIMPYSRNIFGQFMEHFHRQVYGGIFSPGSPLSNEQGFRMDVLEAVRQLRVPIVRWPGGCFVSAYHWADAIGAKRQPAYDKAWLVEDPNTFGTDEFVAWCKEVGAEPYICTNAGSGSPEEMSDWVEYCNGTVGKWARQRAANGSTAPYGVRYWSVGNENYGDWEIGAKTSEQWQSFVTESAKMMLRADPELKLSAAAITDTNWTLPLLRQAGRYLSYVSIHKYWDPLWQKDTPADYGTCMRASTEPEEVIKLAESIIRVAGLADRVKIAFDEWNLRSWHHPSGNGVLAGDIAARDRNDINATYTMADAVFSACFLNACMRHSDSVEIACMAPLVNTRGPIFTHPEGLVRRTTYHVLWMYANLLEKNVASVWAESDPSPGSMVPALDAVATCDDAMQRWRIVLVNRDSERTLSCRIDLQGVRLNGSVAATVLHGDSPDAFNDIDTPDRVTAVPTQMTITDNGILLEPHSVTLLNLQG